MWKAEKVIDQSCRNRRIAIVSNDIDDSLIVIESGENCGNLRYRMGLAERIASLLNEDERI